MKVGAGAETWGGDPWAINQKWKKTSNESHMIIIAIKSLHTIGDSLFHKEVDCLIKVVV